MSKGTILTFSAITERIQRLVSLTKKLKEEESYSIYNLWGIKDDFLEDYENNGYYHERLANRVIMGAVRIRESTSKRLSDVELALEHLRRLLSSVINHSLSRITIDFKSMYRCKVPILFKNLDDAHITSQFLEKVKIEFSYIHHRYTQWTKINCKQQLELLTAY
jgi:hypothetical protein